MGLGYALTEEVAFVAAKFWTRASTPTTSLVFPGSPKIETVLIDNQDLPRRGAESPLSRRRGAVIANAVHDAIGVRMFELPMIPSGSSRP